MGCRLLTTVLVLALLALSPTALSARPVGDKSGWITGTAAADRIRGGPGDDQIRGRGGRDALSGRGGADLIAGDGGADTIQGGPGDDTLLGGTGSDKITGGRGADTIIAGEGNDLVSARDHEVDRVYCGLGRDRVDADAIDVVASNCETVKRHSRRRHQRR